MRRRLSCPLLAGLLVLAAPTATQTASAPAAGPGDFASLRHLPPDPEILLLLRDPLPLLDRILRSPRLEESILGSCRAAGATTLLPAKTPPGWLGSLWALTRPGLGDFLPTEIAFAGTARAMDALGGWFGLGLLAGLGTTAVEAGEELESAERRRLHAALVRQAESSPAPDLVLYLGFRSASRAWSTFRTIRKTVESWLEEWGAPYQQEKSWLAAELKIDEILDLDLLAETLGLEGIEAAAGAGHPLASLGRLSLPFRVEWLGRGILFRLGATPEPGSPGLQGENLGSLWRPGPDLLLHGRLRQGRLAAALNGMVELWKEWRDTRPGKLLREQDEDDLLGDIERFPRLLAGIAGEIDLRVGAGTGLEVLLETRGGEPGLSLRDTGLPRLVPAGAELIHLEGIDSLGEALASLVEQAEGRLAMDDLKRDLGRKAAPLLPSGEPISRAYYRVMASVRGWFLDEAPRAFRPPFAMVGKRGIRLEGFRLEEGGKAAIDFPRLHLPFPGLALIGRLREPGSEEELLGKAWRALAESVLPGDPGNRNLAPPTLDLGLGVPTWGIGFEELAALWPETRITAIGGVRLHAFAAAGFLVFSTSPELSLGILAAWRAGGEEFELPAAGKGRLVAWGRLPGAFLAGLCRDLAAWAAAGELETALWGRSAKSDVIGIGRGGAGEEPPENGIRITGGRPDQGTRTFRDVAFLIAGVLDLVGEIRWSRTDEGGTHLSRVTLELK